MQESTNSLFFSIIIPVYNVAPYLRECLDSVLAQTFGDWEAICVDDGSTDGSGAILDEYAAKDKRFRVIHQSNAGVCIARQKGLDAAKGEYVTWCDPDDVIAPGYVEFVRNFVQSNPTVDIIGFDYETNNTSSGARAYIPQRISKDISQNLEGLLSGTIHGSTCFRVFRHDFILKSKVRFPDYRVIVCEDLLFVFMLMLKNPNVANANRSFYFYRANNESIAHSIRRDDYYKSLKYVGEQFDRIAPNVRISECVKRWKARCRFAAFKEEHVSNAFFNTFFPDIKDISHIKCSKIHRVLFKIAILDWIGRTIAMSVITMARIVKGTRRI